MFAREVLTFGSSTVVSYPLHAFMVPLPKHGTFWPPIHNLTNVLIRKHQCHAFPLHSGLCVVLSQQMVMLQQIHQQRHLAQSP